MVIRSTLARQFAGGPPFRVEPSRLIIEPEHENNVSKLAEAGSENVQELIDKSPIPNSFLADVGNRLKDIGFDVRQLRNTGLIVAEAESLSDVIDNIAEEANTFKKSVVKDLQSLKSKAEKMAPSVDANDLGLGDMNFSSDDRLSTEVALRERLSNLKLKNKLTEAIESIEGVASVFMSYTSNTFGPRNLNIDIDDSFYDADEGDVEELPDLSDAVSKIGAKNVWPSTQGENAIVAVLDTSFNRDFFSSRRIVDSFSGPNVDTPFSAPTEGHGTMSAYTAAGNKNESGLSVSGVAPQAGLLLARTTDSTGALKYIEEAWDWLVGEIKDVDRPVVSNHSYGVPLCSARTMNLCENPTTKLVKAMNKRDDHQAFYAAGNEGLYCGHRLSGATNGINGPNSLPNSISVGALRFDLRDAQSYSSHGFGTCSSLMENPKPDVSCLIPSLLPYGKKVKDMSSGIGGSSGGTSTASPMVCGTAALMASVKGNAKHSVIGDTLEETAMLPRITQVNLLRDFDARFGHGQICADSAVQTLMSNVS